jgi:5-methylcytosine-specific restriction endonuclease McrA
MTDNYLRAARALGSDGGTLDYRAYLKSDEWRQVRARVWTRVRAKYGVSQCERCGVTEDEYPGRLEVHHLDYRFRGRELEEWDLATFSLKLLCGECHAHVHGKGPDPMERDVGRLLWEWSARFRSGLA